MKRALACLIGAAILTAVVACSPADNTDDAGGGETVTLRVADRYPDTHEVVGLFKKYFMDEVTARSGGRITFDYQGNETLMKAPDIPNAVATGLVDMGNTIPIQEQFPEASFMFLPSVATDAQMIEFAKATWPVYRDQLGPKVEPLGIKLLGAGFTTNYQIAGVGTAPTTADLSGHKIRVSGNVLPVAISSLQGTSVNINITEAYEAMSRGVISGVGLAVPAYRGYQLPEQLKWAVVNADMGVAIYSYGINKQKFDSLPADLQEVLVDVGNEFAEKATADYIKLVDSEIADWKTKNIQVITWDDTQKTAASTAMVKVWQDWINKTEPKADNLPDLLAAWQASLAKEGIPLAAPLQAAATG